MLTIKRIYPLVLALLLIVPNLAFAIDVDELESRIAAEQDVQRTAACPGLGTMFLDIASNCGNNVCDLALGENESTCPMDCTFYKYGAYNLLPTCDTTQRLHAPSTTAEVIDIVSQAVSDGRRIKVVGNLHSASGAICTDGVTISTENLDDLSTATWTGNIVHVPPGITMRELGQFLADGSTNGYGSARSVGFAHLGFSDATVAGSIGTSAHGSSPIHTNTISNYVASMKVVGPDGVERTFTRDSSDTWKALQSHLGLLGVITELGIETEPHQNVRVNLTFHAEHELFTGTKVAGLIENCDWVQFNWFPGQDKFIKWCGVLTDDPADAGAENKLLGITGIDAATLAPAFKWLYHRGACFADTARFMEQLRYDMAADQSNALGSVLFKNNANGVQVPATEVVGSPEMVTSSSLIELGQHTYVQMDWEVAIPQQHIQDAFDAAQARFNLEGNLSIPTVGVFARFGKIEDGGLLTYHGAGDAGSKFVAGETALFWETPITVPQAFPQDRLDEYFAPFRELIYQFIDDYDARPHPGKNIDDVFERFVAHGSFDGRLQRFNVVANEFDEYGVFSNEYTRDIYGIVPSQYPDDFSNAFSSTNTCGCSSSEYDAVCDGRTKEDYATTCRLECDGGSTDAAKLPGICERYRFNDFNLGWFGNWRYAYDKNNPNPFASHVARFRR